jgi:hypothetical protein
MIVVPMWRMSSTDFGWADGQPVLRDGDHILDHAAKDPAQGFVAAAHRVEAGIEAVHLLEGRTGDRKVHQVVFGEQAGAQTVMQVMVRIGHVIGDGGNLCFGACMGVNSRSHWALTSARA